MTDLEVSQQATLVTFGVAPGQDQEDRKKFNGTVLFVRDTPREAIDLGKEEYLKNTTRKIWVIPYKEKSGFQRFAVVEERP